MIPRGKISGRQVLFLGAALFAITGGTLLLRAQNARPNVVFITLDSLRADHLGCYGYKRNTSPNIDALSEKGALFTRTVAQASATTASVSSIITSLYPNDQLNQPGAALSSEDENLVRVLKENGYTTALFGNTQAVLNVTFSNIRSDFDIFNNREGKADKVVDRVSEWVKKIFGTPVFLWVYLFDTHAPYRAALSYSSEFLSDGLYPRQNVPIAENDGNKNEFFSFRRISRFVAEEGITDTSYYIAKYDGGIKFADEQIGRLLRVLRDNGMDENTLIVLFADHGESMTEHNFYFNHSHYLYECLVRVPLIMVFPPKIPPKIVSAPVPMLGIMPTVLEILGIKNTQHMEGESLLPLIDGEKNRLAPYIFSKSSVRPFLPRSVRSEHWKLIFNYGRGYDPARKEYELYDLKTDPEELNNLAEKHPGIVALLKDQLDQWEKSAKTCQILGPKDLDEQKKENLRSLGYMQ